MAGIEIKPIGMHFVRFLMVLVIFIFSCNTKPKPVETNIIPEHKFVRLLIDYHLAQGVNSSELYRSKASKFREYSLADSVIAYHGLTRSDLDSTLAYYARNPQKFNQIYDKVMAEFSRRTAEIQEKLEKEKKAR